MAPRSKTVLVTAVNTMWAFFQKFDLITRKKFAHIEKTGKTFFWNLLKKFKRINCIHKYLKPLHGLKKLFMFSKEENLHRSVLYHKFNKYLEKEKKNNLLKTENFFMLIRELCIFIYGFL